MTREAFGAEFQCSANKKHRMNLYFFDSQPTEHACPHCDDGTVMNRIRVLDMGKEAGRRLAIHRQKDRKSGF